jgi:glutaredoxin
LTERRIPFREVNVAHSAQAAQELQRRSGQTGVPVIDVNGKIIIGFDQPRLVQALGLRS